MASVIIWAILYIFCGISKAIVKQSLGIFGISDQTTLLVTQVTFSAYVLSGTRFFQSTSSESVNSSKKTTPKSSATIYILLYSLILIMGSWLCNIGARYAGSGLFQVLYASVIVFCAISQYIAFKKSKTYLQMMGIAIIVAGLAISAVPRIDLTSNDGLAFGILVSLFGTFILSLSYIIDEFMMNNVDRFGYSGQDFSFSTGVISLIIVSVYQLIVIVPRWDVVTNMVSQWNIVCVLLFCQLIIETLGSVAYYRVIGGLGATSTGVMQGVTSVGVFGLSSFLFCEYQAHQCFTFAKGMSTLVVVAGIITYSLGAPKKKLD